MTVTNENSSAEPGEILKVDVLGRVTVPKEKREELLDSFEASGMSGAQFAQHHGIHVQTFASWIQKRRRARGDYDSEETRRKLRMRKKSKKGTAKPRPQSRAANNTSLSLVEVSLDPPDSSEEALEIVLPDGIIIRVRNTGQIAMLKTILHELTC